MIYINDEQKSVDDLLKIVKESTGVEVNLDVLKKNTSFKVNPILPAIDLGKSQQRGGRVMKKGQGFDILSHFRIYNQKDSNSYIIRYASSPSYKRGGNIVYTPLGVPMTPELHDVRDGSTRNIDLLLYIYLHPRNKQSPFRDSDKGFWYEHINEDEIVNKKINEANKVAEAITFANRLGQYESTVYAKALGIDIKNRTAEQIKGLVVVEASINTASFLKVKASNLIQTKAAVEAALDTGVIVATRLNNGTRYTFEDGEEILVANSRNPKQDLVTHVIGNVQRYLGKINSLSAANISKTSASDYLESVGSIFDVGVKEAPVEEELKVEISVSEVVDTVTAKDFLNKVSGGYNGSPKMSKKFGEDVLSGVITDANVMDEIHKYLSKQYSIDMGIETDGDDVDDL